MARNKDDVLSLGVDLDVKGALREMARFQKDMTKQIGAVSKSMENFADLNKKATKATVKGTEKLKDAVEDLTDAYEAETRIVKDLEKRLADAHGDEKKALEDELRLLKEANKERTKASKGGKVRQFYTKQTEIADGKTLKKMWGDGARDAASEFKSGVKAAFSKDLKGAIEGAFKGSGKTIETVFSGTLSSAATALFKGGKGLGKLGGGLAARGKQKGGIGGGAMSVAGTGLKALGGISAKIAPLLQLFSKLGPLVTMLSTAIVAVVKTFIDAEAQAKAFQKEVLQSASTVEFLAQSGGDVDEAFSSLESTVKGVRDAAYDLDNLEWGITAEEHKAVVNVLNQEGVSLRRIGQEAALSKKSVQEFAADLTHVSVAYSRAFGVPLQEINQLQAEMMSELGMSLNETKLSFAQMTRAAGESGIAANKFFAIIRGVSQDLSLYNNRMEDAVRILKMLGKVMNPREAQKFMQTAMQGMKQMGRQERLRATLLAGPGKMKALVERDIERGMKQIVKTVGEHSGESEAQIRATIAKGPAAIEAMINKLPEEVQGTVRSGITDMELQKTRAGKGTFGVSGAAANLGPGAALEAMQGALLAIGGGKTLRDSAGNIGTEMMADNLGVSQEQLDQMIKFEMAIDRQRALLKDQLQKNADGSYKDQEAAQKALEGLKKAGLDASQIDSAGYDQILDTLDSSTKEQLTQGTKVEDFAKKQANLTQDLLSKLGVLVDFVMNQLYNVLVDMYDAILRIPGVGGSGKADALRAAKATGNVELQKVFSGKDANGGLAGTVLVKSMNKAFDDLLSAKGRMGSATAEKAALEAKSIRTAEDDDRLAALDKEIATIRSQTKTGRDVRDTMLAALPRTVFGKGAEGSFADAGLSEDQRTKAYEAMTGGSSAKDALSGVGASEEQILMLLRKLPVWTNNIDDAGGSRATMFGDVGKQLQAGGYYNPDQQRIDEAHAASAKDTAAAIEHLDAHGTKDGTLYTKFSTRFLKADYKNTVEEAVLSAMRLALFEYYMYSELDRGQVAEHFAKNGITSPADFSKSISEGALMGMTADQVLEMPANANGGVVTGVTNGMAMVRAAGGEGLASIGRGERIVPAGGGGATNINISVPGVGGRDLEQIIRAKVIDGIAEYKRRERFT